jgi:Tfp pilus assembly PilM family ATPase
LGQKLTQEIKTKYGVRFFSLASPMINEKFQKPFFESLEPILREVKLTLQGFYQDENKEVKKIIITGGISFLPGIKEYFQNYFKKDIEIADPFKGLIYPPALEPELKRMGPFYSVAVGMARKGLELVK